MDAIPTNGSPLHKDTVALVEAAVRELTRAEAALSVARFLIDEAAHNEWPYDEEMVIAPSEEEWKEHGTRELWSISGSLSRVLQALRQGNLANVEEFFLRAWRDGEDDDDGDIPYGGLPF